MWKFELYLPSISDFRRSVGRFLVRIWSVSAIFEWRIRSTDRFHVSSWVPFNIDASPSQAFWSISNIYIGDSIQLPKQFGHPPRLSPSVITGILMGRSSIAICIAKAIVIIFSACTLLVSVDHGLFSQSSLNRSILPCMHRHLISNAQLVSCLPGWLFTPFLQVSCTLLELPGQLQPDRLIESNTLLGTYLPTPSTLTDPAPGTQAEKVHVVRAIYCWGWYNHGIRLHIHVNPCTIIFNIYATHDFTSTRRHFDGPVWCRSMTDKWTCIHARTQACLDTEYQIGDFSRPWVMVMWACWWCVLVCVDLWPLAWFLLSPPPDSRLVDWSP